MNIVGIMFIIIGLISLLEGVWGIISIAIGIFIIYISKKDEEKQKQKNEEREIQKKKYNKLKTTYEKRKEYYEKHKTYTKGKYGNIFIIENNKLCKLEHLLDFSFYFDILKKEIPDSHETKWSLDSIKYYQLEGSKHEEQIISGGGGGGSSIKGAIAGEIIAGGVGAIIGSRKKVNEIKTEYKRVDDRRTTITLKDNNQIECGPNVYELLLEYIPEKEYDNYISNKKAKGKKNI